MALDLPLAPYLYWAKTRTPAAIDLAGSNLLHCTMDDLPGFRGALELTAPNDNGFPPLVHQIASHYGVDPARVVSADGCSGANFVAIATLVGPDDDVLIEEPGYDPLVGACRLMRANVHRFERSFEDRYGLDLARLEAQLTPRTRLIVVTNPHNPTGTYLNVDSVTALGELAESAKATVLVDEVYLDGARLASANGAALRSAAVLDGPFVVTNSLTKSYGLAGLRNGWAIADASVAERMRRTRDVIDNANSAVSDRLALHAFVHLAQLEHRTRQLLSRNLEIARTFFRVHTAFEIAHPPAASVVFPRLAGRNDAAPFVEFLLERYDVAVAPGSFFGQRTHFRVSLAGRTDVLEAGLTKLSDAVSAYR